MSECRGDWIQTFTGRQFWPLDPRPEEVWIEDIAHALSLQCRFTGHCREFYSVCDHSIRVANYVHTCSSTWDWFKQALLHDAAEAYLVDLARPIKRSGALGEEYCKVEQVVHRAIFTRFGLDPVLPDIVHEADDRLLVTEMRDLMAPPPVPWRETCEPLPDKILPLTPAQAEAEFLRLFNDWSR